MRKVFYFYRMMIKKLPATAPGMITADEFSVYPNPANDKLYVDFDLNETGFIKV
ncbi:MAG: hypothetical protein ACP5DZ_03975 [Bacteroidales bacterium]